MSLRLHTFFLIAALGSVVACSSPQSKESSEPVTEAPKEAAPQCFQGCMLNSAGECTTEGNVMDWSGAQRESIACDPRCCQSGAAGGSGTDADGDGIHADADQCPDKAEDLDGFQDDDGCPEEDNDQDGIKDDSDLCPLDAEDVDGFQDDDGCPDP